jgi:NifU-like protein involved in Fe-S cluster formation
MNASSAQSLYSREVLRLATSLPHDERIAAPFVSANRRAPICGSEMTIDVVMDNGAVNAIAIRAKACALGQASAAILREGAHGKSLLQIEAVFSEVKQALGGEGPMPKAYEPLDYARDYPARHGAILLPFETLIAAISGTHS